MCVANRLKNKILLQKYSLHSVVPLHYTFTYLAHTVSFIRAVRVEVLKSAC